MGKGYSLKCAACHYSLSVTEGIGMMYSPHAVFYGRCDDPAQHWSIALPDGFCEEGKPLLLSLVKSKRIRDQAFGLLLKGAVPADHYGHELYVCPNCNLLANRFHFILKSEMGQFEPDYRCPKCKTLLRRVKLKHDENGQSKVVYKNNHPADWKCPVCGCGKLILGNFEWWD